MCRDRGDSTTALGADKSQHLCGGAFLPFTPAATGADKGFQQLIADQGLKQVLTAAASHGLDDDLRPVVGRDGEDRRVRIILMDEFGNVERFCGAFVEIDEANVRRGTATPVEKRTIPGVIGYLA